MGQLTRSTVIQCAPNRVFEVLSSVERLPEFSEMTVAVEGPGRPIQQGDTFDQVVRVLGRELQTTWQVTELQPDQLLRYEGSGPGGSRATLTERIGSEADGTRVEIDVDYDLPMGVLGDAVDAVYLHSKNEEKAEEILSRLKALCEAG